MFTKEQDIALHRQVIFKSVNGALANQNLTSLKKKLLHYCGKVKEKHLGLTETGRVK